jgi:crotonobetainyl-CoA:carnitine CoA-transferase CaiB-like acyl-CoA transferase
MGADVIKVESLTGDLCRFWGPFIQGQSRLFQAWNRNKRSLSIDLRSDAGKDVVRQLASKSDVVVENFRPGVTERLGIDYASLSVIQPQIIYCSSSAFGDRGPDRDRPGYDPVLQSTGGSAAAQELMSGNPSICSVAVSDYQAAMLCVSGINAALFHRERTGKGQHIRTSLLQAIMSVQSHAYVQPLDHPEDGPAGIFPYRMFDTAEGPLFIAAGTDKFWRFACEVLATEAPEMLELAEHPDYATNPKRVAHAEALTVILHNVLNRLPALEWERRLIEKGVPCAAVRTSREFFDDPQVAAMAMNPVIDHPVCGALRVAGVPIEFAESPGAIQRPAPILGQHSREILEEIGIPGEQVETLLRDGVVATESDRPS